MSADVQVESQSKLPDPQQEEDRGRDERHRRDRSPSPSYRGRSERSRRDREDDRRRDRSESPSRRDDYRDRYRRERRRYRSRSPRDYERRRRSPSDRYERKRSRSPRPHPRSTREDNNDEMNDRDLKRNRTNEANPATNPANPPTAGKLGGVYMPPAKLAMLQKEITDKSSIEYQKMSWEALKKSINGLINKVSVGNIENLIPEIFYENLIRGRGLFVRSIMKAQAASPNFTPVYAALVAVINTKLPELGELLLKRLIIQFRKAYRRNHKPTCLATAQFIAHLVNQHVLGIIVPLQMVTLLLEKPTDDSVEVACSFLTESGAALQDQTPQGFNRIFDRFRSILHEGEIDKRTQYTIEMLFAVRKKNFAEHPSIRQELDLVDVEDQITHEDLSLEDKLDPEDRLNFFHFDENFLENERKYEEIKKEVLGEDKIEEMEGRDESGEEESDEEEEEQPVEDSGVIRDDTDTDLVNLRRTIYLTIMSSVDFAECAHKLLKINLKPGQEIELCNMLIECCSQERTYMRFYGLLAQRFCLLDKQYQECFDQTFVEQYSTIHRLETNKLRNVAKFFAHLLQSDALPWAVLEYIHLNEDETTSSSRIFIKIIFQELAEWLGLKKLNERLNDEDQKEHFEGLFPRDDPKNTRFAINFFTSIGLGGLTDGLREWLANAPKAIQAAESESESDSSSESSSSESDSDSDSSSSSSSSDSDSDQLILFEKIKGEAFNKFVF